MIYYLLNNLKTAPLGAIIMLKPFLPIGRQSLSPFLYYIIVFLKSLKVKW